MLAMSVQQERMGTQLGQLMSYVDRIRQREPRENGDTDRRRNAPSSKYHHFSIYYSALTRHLGHYPSLYA